MALEFGDDDYLIQFPLAIIVERASGNIEFIEIEGATCLPIFTDDDLLERFVPGASWGDIPRASRWRMPSRCWGAYSRT